MPLTLNLEINIDDNEEPEFGGKYRKFSQTLALSKSKLSELMTYQTVLRAVQL